MIAIEKYLRFEGPTADALAFVETMREIQYDTGLDYPKVFRDFIFNIEVALQHEGILDADFNKIEETNHA